MCVSILNVTVLRKSSVCTDEVALWSNFRTPLVACSVISATLISPVDNSQLGGSINEDAVP